MEKRKRYQDYVIKDGKFIGKFEEMYRDFANPWHQLEMVDQSYSRWDTILTLKNYHITSAVEIGCGLGKFTDMIKKQLPYLRIEGIDVSKTAIDKARKSYPDIPFESVDLLTYCKKSAPLKGETNAFIFAEIMWYILNDLNEIIDIMSTKYKGTFVIINQVFYKGQQQYGTDFFTNLDELERYLPWECLQRMENIVRDQESIETHSVFKI